MANPEAMDAADLSVIEEYRKKFPYSPVFAGMYAKVLHNLKDLKYDEALRDAAMVMPDRGVLYQLIYKEPLQVKIRAVNDQIEQIEVIATEEKKVPEEKVEVEDIQDTTSIVRENNELEQDILIEAINTSIQLDVDQLLEEEIPDSIEEWKEEDQSETQVVVDKPALSKPSKFSDWLFAMKDTNVKEPEEEERKELLSSSDLIDRFIKTKPRKIDISKEPVTPQEMGKLSLVEDDVFVTETLAEIYAKQGKYRKAIKIYEQLSLNNPEKKVFFASRIRFLREKLEYDK